MSYGPVTPDDVDHDEDGPQGADWLGHRDLCSLQWSSRCDCNDPIDEETVPPDTGAQYPLPKQTDPATCRHTVTEYDDRGRGTCRLCGTPV